MLVEVVLQEWNIILLEQRRTQLLVHLFLMMLLGKYF